jgi:hypothetical protein
MPTPPGLKDTHATETDRAVNAEEVFAQAARGGPFPTDGSDGQAFLVRGREERFVVTSRTTR